MVRALAFLPLLLVGCAAGGADEPTSPTSIASPDGEWVTLFDGASLDGWRGYNRDDIPAAWAIQGDLLTFTPGGDGGDIVTDETYEDFELELEWRVGACGNSGIFYHAEESPELRATWQTALEMQILDDSCHADAQYPSHRAGALYDLYVPTTETASPAGEWTSVRIVVEDGEIEHWQNGERVVSARVGSPDWRARVAASKFRDGAKFPAYGTRTSGHIGLQDHGDPVAFRNLRIRRL